MSFDVDIDLPTNFKVETIFPNWVKASILKNEELTPHPCGVYPQNIAKDYVTNLSAIPYDIAETLGYLKLDFLHNSAYDIFESREQIEALLDLEPNWNLLLVPSVVVKLFQLSNHYELLQKVKPKSIEELSDVLALIRPGKSNLLEDYLKDKKSIRPILYKKDAKGYSFKKSHSISYALVIVLQLHLAEMELL